MKNIIKNLLLPVAILASAPLFMACESDTDSNPTFHKAESFVLNVPANAANNTYDLAKANSLNLTCNQPDYGGFPLATAYTVEVSIDPNYASADTAVSKKANYKELATTYTSTQIPVDASELNDAVVALYQEANDGADYPDEARSIYIRLKAQAKGLDYGVCESNTITLPSVLATYVAPAIKLPTELFIIGSSIQEAWTTWKPMAAVYGLEGQFYTMIYCPDGAEFKWGTYKNNWRGYTDITTIKDDANAGLSENGGNIKVEKGGWYVVFFKAKIVGKEIQYTMNFELGTAYIIGATTGEWNDADANWALTAPSDASGQWESPAFAGDGELRAYIKVPGLDWWRTEYTLYSGALYFRDIDIATYWEENKGADYSVKCTTGQKLYVNFDNNTGEVK